MPETTLQNGRKELRNQDLKRYGILLTLSGSVGIVVGLAAVFFRHLLALINNAVMMSRLGLDYDPYSPTITTLGWLVIFAPAIGGLIAGLLTYRYAPEAKGHGVTEVMEAMLVKQGKIRPRVALVKALASAFTIGTGGSAGREGPMVQIGAASGSGIAQKMGLSSDETMILLGCGAAAGIAATFNTPLGGVLFALELVLLEFRTRSFVPLVVSTMMATFVARAFMGNVADLQVTNLYNQFSAFEIPLYILLGIICGIMGLFFSQMLHGIERWADGWKMRPYLKPMMGGLLVGVIGLALYLQFGRYYVFGLNYYVIMPVLESNVVDDTVFHLFVLLILLVFLKTLTTSLTLGTGGSGGIFAPMLVFGAMVGGAFGILMHWIFPVGVAPFGAYAIVGMAALFAGASRATLTAIVMMFELTLSYSIILPLMIACVFSLAVSSMLSEESVYTIKLREKGIRYTFDREVNHLKLRVVKDAMITEVTTVDVNTTPLDVMGLAIKTGSQGFPILDEKGHLCGIVTSADAKNAIKNGKSDLPLKDAVDIKPPMTVCPDQSLYDALEIMKENDFGRLPVVNRSDPTILVGLITRSKIVQEHRDKGRTN